VQYVPQRVQCVVGRLFIRRWTYETRQGTGATRGGTYAMPQWTCPHTLDTLSGHGFYPKAPAVVPLKTRRHRSLGSDGLPEMASNAAACPVIPPEWYQWLS
jgi:hypothetical protein